MEPAQHTKKWRLFCLRQQKKKKNNKNKTFAVAPRSTRILTFSAQHYSNGLQLWDCVGGWSPPPLLLLQPLPSFCTQIFYRVFELHKKVVTPYCNRSPPFHLSWQVHVSQLQNELKVFFCACPSQTEKKDDPPSIVEIATIFVCYVIAFFSKTAVSNLEIIDRPNLEAAASPHVKCDNRVFPFFKFLSFFSFFHGCRFLFRRFKNICLIFEFPPFECMFLNNDDDGNLFETSKSSIKFMKVLRLGETIWQQCNPICKPLFCRQCVYLFFITKKA